MVYSDYVKQRILFYHRSGKKYAGISHCLSEEGDKISKAGVFKFLRHYLNSGKIAREPGTGQASKATPTIHHLIEEQMQRNDEAKGLELQQSVY